MALCPSCKNEYMTEKCSVCGYEPRFFLAEAGSTIQEVFAFAEAGDIASVSLIANCYLKGEGVYPDLVKAYDYNMLAAEKYYARSCNNIAIIFDKGIGQERNTFSALCYCKMALELEYEPAMSTIEYLLHSTDKKNAQEYYDLISGLDNQSLYLVKQGICREFGYGTQKDDKMAFYSYSQAAAQNDLTGLYNTAYMQEFGIGTDKDISAALTLYEKAACGGYPAAMYRLALLYKKNWEIRDDEKSFNYLCLSADHGVEKAQLWLSNRFSGESKLEKTLSQYWYIQSLRQQGRKNSALLRELIAKQKLANPTFPQPPDGYKEYIQNGYQSVRHQNTIEIKNNEKSNINVTSEKEETPPTDIISKLLVFSESTKNEKLQALLNELTDRINSLKMREDELFKEQKQLFTEYLPSLCTLLEAYILYEHSKLDNETIVTAKENIEKSIIAVNTTIEKTVNELITSHAQRISDEAIALISKLESDGLCNSDDSLSKH